MPGNTFAAKYRLLKKVGIRSYVEVWQAVDESSQDKVIALKIYSPERGMDDFSLKLFYKDLGELLRLSHSNLLKIFHFDLWQGFPFLVMPFCSGGSLYQKLLEEGSLPEEGIAKVLYQIGNGLTYLHENGVLHRNIKPDNILIDSDGNYLLSEYGISTRLNNILRKNSSGDKVVSLSYAPPELFGSRQISSREGDIFALGVLIYEMCTGEQPWMGAGGSLMREDTVLPELPLGYTRGLQQLMQHCLQFHEAARPSAANISLAGKIYLQQNKWPTPYHAEIEPITVAAKAPVSVPVEKEIISSLPKEEEKEIIDNIISEELLVEVPALEQPEEHNSVNAEPEDILLKDAANINNEQELQISPEEMLEAILTEKERSSHETPIDDESDKSDLEIEQEGQEEFIERYPEQLPMEVKEETPNPIEEVIEPVTEEHSKEDDSSIADFSLPIESTDTFSDEEAAIENIPIEIVETEEVALSSIEDRYDFAEELATTELVDEEKNLPVQANQQEPSLNVPDNPTKNKYLESEPFVVYPPSKKKFNILWPLLGIIAIAALIFIGKLFIDKKEVVLPVVKNDNYLQMIQEGDGAMQEGQFSIALEKYEGALLICTTNCDLAESRKAIAEDSLTAAYSRALNLGDLEANKSNITEANSYYQEALRWKKDDQQVLDRLKRMSSIENVVPPIKEDIAQTRNLKSVTFKDNQGRSYSYSGEAQNGLPNGDGEAIYSDGSTYKGEFVNGKQSGEGMMTWPDGMQYLGQFYNNRFHGKGLLIFANGERYEGKFRNGEKVGN